MGNDTNRLAEFQLAQAAAPRANAEPLPGALGSAFGQDSILVGEIEVRKIVASDWIILKQLDSPVYKMQLGDNPDEIKITDEENMELIFQFINPIATVRQMLKVGRDYYREQALQTISDKLESEEIVKLVGAVTEQFNRYFAIRLKFIQDAQTEGKETVINFQEQPAQVKQA